MIFFQEKEKTFGFCAAKTQKKTPNLVLNPQPIAHLLVI